MVNKCSVYGCLTNHDGHEQGTVFGLKSVEDPGQRDQWLRFCNRSDLKPDGSVFICAKHFDEKFMRRNDKQPRLIKKLLPVPTIQPAGVYDEKPSCKPTPTTSRKAPTQRIFQQDEMGKCEKTFKVCRFEDLDESLLDFHDNDYRYAGHGDHVVLFKFVLNDLSIPQITECIRIDSNLHVKLFYKNSPIPLPSWFRKGTDCKFKSKDVLSNFSAHILPTTTNQNS